MIRECKEEEIKGIKISSYKDNTTLLFMDDQVIVADSEDALQISIHKLETVTSKYGLKFSKSRTKTMAFKGRDPVRSKIVINTNIIKQINTFNYLGCSISYKNAKISKFTQIMEIINVTSKPSEVQKHNRPKIYNTLALPTFLHRCAT
jgi:hypothetical protein